MTHKEGTAVVLLSGGQDSTTCLYIAKERHEQVLAVSIDYGQSHRKELGSAAKIARVAGVPWKVMNLPGGCFDTSPITSPLKVFPSYSRAEEIEPGPAATIVPLRNLVFLSLAASFAISQEADYLYLGATSDDAFGYPDCGPSFLHACREAILLGHPMSPVQLVTPLLEQSKVEIVRMMKEYPGLEEAIALSWTCYVGGYRPCGRCRSCVVRADAFEQAGEVDPAL